MKTRTALILIALLASTTVSCVNHAGGRKPDYPHERDFSDDFSEDFPDAGYELHPMDEVTTELVTHRSAWDCYLVEVSTGTVTTAEGDGRLDLPEPYNYISYRDLAFDTDPGDRIITYAVYEIHSGGEDDIIARYDYSISH